MHQGFNLSFYYLFCFLFFILLLLFLPFFLLLGNILVFYIDLVVVFLSAYLCITFLVVALGITIYVFDLQQCVLVSTFYHVETFYLGSIASPLLSIVVLNIRWYYMIFVSVIKYDLYSHKKKPIGYIHISFSVHSSFLMLQDFLLLSFLSYLKDLLQPFFKGSILVTRSFNFNFPQCENVFSPPVLLFPQIQNSWLTFLLSALLCCAISFWPPQFQMGNLSSFKLVFPYRQCVVFLCFQEFFFVSNYHKCNYHVSWHEFLWVYLI